MLKFWKFPQISRYKKAGKTKLAYQARQPIQLSLPSRLYLSLIIVIGTALLKYYAWIYLSLYGAIALLWAFLILRVSPRHLSKLLGTELIFLVFVALPMGWEKASFLLVRSLICLMVMNSFLLTLPPHSLGITLKSLPLPTPFQTTLLLAGQYIEILFREIQQMQRAAKLRGLKGNGNWLRYTSAAMIGSLYLRSLHRAERIHSAMMIRGYQGDWPLNPTEQNPNYLAVFMIAAIAATITIASYF